MIGEKLIALRTKPGLTKEDWAQIYLITDRKAYRLELDRYYEATVPPDTEECEPSVALRNDMSFDLPPDGFKGRTIVSVNPDHESLVIDLDDGMQLSTLIAYDGAVPFDDDGNLNRSFLSVHYHRADKDDKKKSMPFASHATKGDLDSTSEETNLEFFFGVLFKFVGCLLLLALTLGIIFVGGYGGLNPLMVLLSLPILIILFIATRKNE